MITFHVLECWCMESKCTFAGIYVCRFFFCLLVSMQKCRYQNLVKMTVVSCPTVVDITIVRPDLKFQLGFAIQDGVVWHSLYHTVSHYMCTCSCTFDSHIQCMYLLLHCTYVHVSVAVNMHVHVLVQCIWYMSLIFTRFIPSHVAP